MINQLIKKTAETFNKSTVSQPEAKLPSPAKPAVEPKPMDSSPLGLAKAAAEAAGFVVGQEYHGKTMRNNPPNAKYKWVKMDNWGEPVLFSVQNQADWSANETIYGFYAGPDAQGRLKFDNRDGVRRNKFGRRR